MVEQGISCLSLLSWICSLMLLVVVLSSCEGTVWSTVWDSHLKGKHFVGDLILTVNSRGGLLHGPCVWDITLYPWMMIWFKIQIKVCVGWFVIYTDALRMLSFLLTRTSRKAKDPLSSVSIVNWMDGLTEFICWRKLVKVSLPCGHTIKDYQYSGTK